MFDDLLRFIVFLIANWNSVVDKVQYHDKLGARHGRRRNVPNLS
jgi:hypothetical protein